MTHKKSELKEQGSYYYESKPWYDACPEILPEIPEPKVEILTRTMSYREILKEYDITPYASYAEAASAIAHIKPTIKYPSRIAYFTEDGTTYRLDAWRRGDGQFGLGVDGLDLAIPWHAERGVVFSNGTLDASGATLRPSESLPLGPAFLKTFANVPLGMRTDIIYTTDKYGPMSWYVVWTEVKADTEIAKEILAFLKAENII